MQGQIIKIHSDFYYIQTEIGLVEAKLREILKKRKAEIFVGDIVELEQINTTTLQAFIKNIIPRKNFIPRPKAANIDQIIIVSALKEPELDFIQLNRYLCCSEYYKIPVILCFNKNDLNIQQEKIEIIKNIYNQLNYKTIFISALEKKGFNTLEKELENKVSVLCGMSGVGKSSILNVLAPNLNLRTKGVSSKTQKGTHTTRHCELISITLSNLKSAKIVDTPGFSNLKFDFLLPTEISELFPEINNLKTFCKFKDCLHLNETECNVLKNLSKIHLSRYESYKKFLTEAKEFKETITYNGIKKETKSKKINNEEVTKISSKKRVLTRKTSKQIFSKDFNGENNDSF